MKVQDLTIFLEIQYPAIIFFLLYIAFLLCYTHVAVTALLQYIDVPACLK